MRKKEKKCLILPDVSESKYLRICQSTLWMKPYPAHELLLEELRIKAWVMTFGRK